MDASSYPVNGNNTRAVIYCRVSSDSQEREGTSLDTQYDACTSWCKKHGHTVVKIYKESYSGLTLERPSLQDIRDLVSERIANVVVCYSLDRLSRDPVHLLLLMDEFDKRKVNLEVVTETVDSSDIGKLVTHVRGFSAKLEAVKIKERTLRGRKFKAMAGFFTSNPNLYGYRLDHTTGKRVIYEPEATAVRAIYHTYIKEHLSFRQLSNSINAQGFCMASGGAWNSSALHRILQNPAYYGETIVFKSTYRINIPHFTPPIISETDYQAVQSRLESNKRLYTRERKQENLLAGFVYCDLCGKRMIRKRGSTQNNSYFWCRHGCKGQTVRADSLETKAWDIITTELSDKERVERIISEQIHSGEAIAILNADLIALESHLRSLERRKNSGANLLLELDPEDQPPFLRQYKQVCEDIKVITTDIHNKAETIGKLKEATSSAIELSKTFKEYTEDLASLNVAGKRKVFEKLQLRVVVTAEAVRYEGIFEVLSSHHPSIMGQIYIPWNLCTDRKRKNLRA